MKISNFIRPIGGSNSQGFSVIEVVLAAALFMLFSTSAVGVVLQGFNANRLGAEETTANQFAAEGIEAVKSIKNQAYSTLTACPTAPSTTGVIRDGVTFIWKCSGTNNTLTHNSGDNYIRTIKIDSVNRDAAPPAGNIISPGGTLDTDTKKITSTVAWNFNSARPESVVLSTYLSDWRKPIGNNGDGVLVYGDSASLAQPKYRIYTDSSNTFNAQAAAGATYTDTVVGKTFKIKTSPAQQQALAGYVNSSGTLRILCFDGANWTSEWTTSVGGTATNDQRFGIAYEQTTGNSMVVYSKGVASPSIEMAYRYKTAGACGAGWGAETSLDAVRTTGTVQWIRAESSPASGTNRIYIAWADSNSDLSANVWSGSAWLGEPSSALETNLERVTTSQDVQSFDIAVESTSGNLMVVWGLSQSTTCTAQATDTATLAATNCIRYARYTGSWGAVRVIPVVADPATNIDISANPNSGSNELVVASVDDSQADLSIAYWSGSAWTGFANQDTTCQAATAGSKRVTTGWLINGAQTRYIVVYNDSGTTNIGWFVGGPTFTSAPTAQTDFTPAPAFVNPQTWYDIQTNPKTKSKLSLTLSDNSSDLFSKRLSMNSSGTFTSPDGWTNTDGNTPPGGVALELNLGQVAPGPFSFAYWRNP